jgi:hypothetical protein
VDCRRRRRPFRVAAGAQTRLAKPTAAYEGFGGSLEWDVYAYCLKKEKKR